jgi:hypothetical protein
MGPRITKLLMVAMILVLSISLLFVIGQYKIRINGHEKSSTCNWQSR